MTERITYYHYVRHSERRAFEALGWRFSCHLGTPHSAYSALFEWAGPGPPVTPHRDGSPPQTQIVNECPRVDSKV